MQAFASSAQNAVKFTMTMKPENEWHYQGAGVTLGETGQAIAWWRPQAGVPYRILWADLTMTESNTPPAR